MTLIFILGAPAMFPGWPPMGVPPMPPGQPPPATPGASSMPQQGTPKNSNLLLSFHFSSLILVVLCSIKYRYPHHGSFFWFGLPPSSTLLEFPF